MSVKFTGTAGVTGVDVRLYRGSWHATNHSVLRHQASSRDLPGAVVAVITMMQSMDGDQVERVADAIVADIDQQIANRHIRCPRRRAAGQALEQAISCTLDAAREMRHVSDPHEPYADGDGMVCDESVYDLEERAEQLRSRWRILICTGS